MLRAGAARFESTAFRLSVEVRGAERDELDARLLGVGGLESEESEEEWRDSTLASSSSLSM
ncbi:hypothetical protein EON62_06350 [archaeon]|nr:MAG: hypothetical protein EON62_06350 [archaeon]